MTKSMEFKCRKNTNHISWMLLSHAICYHIGTEAPDKTAYTLQETDKYIVCKSSFFYFDSNLNVFEGPND